MLLLSCTTGSQSRASSLSAPPGLRHSPVGRVDEAVLAVGRAVILDRFHLPRVRASFVSMSRSELGPPLRTVTLTDSCTLEVGRRQNIECLKDALPPHPERTVHRRISIPSIPEGNQHLWTHHPLYLPPQQSATSTAFRPKRPSNARRQLLLQHTSGAQEL